ncbi:MAG: hypothetical protein KDA89_19430, partial [Planctomycetaceae bacterium]|nr:hypothetical protein [Planctomycetaceae bacterium]
MLISSWLQSFRNRLQGPRRIRRRSPIVTRRTAHSLELLENRTLLTAPDLVAVSPNFGTFITDGTQLTERPQELTFQFSPGQVIDEATLGAIQITGAGFDGSLEDGGEYTVTPGFRGIGDNLDQVIFRFAQPLQDDLYQISILGSGATPLTNNAGEAFRGGADQTIQFTLDLGATVRAVVPQPVVRDQVLTISNVSLLRDGDRITVDDGGGSVVFEFEDTAVGNGTGSNIAVTFSASDSASVVAGRLKTAIDGATFAGPGVTTTLNGAQLTIR